MYIIDKSLEGPDEDKETSEVKNISLTNSFRGRKYTSGSATSDYFSYNGDPQCNLQDFQKPHNLIPEPDSESNSDIEFGLEKLELPNDENTAS